MEQGKMTGAVLHGGSRMLLKEFDILKSGYRQVLVKIIVYIREIFFALNFHFGPSQLY